VVQALLDNLIERGLDPKICRLFIIDGSKALTKAIRRAFGRNTPIQRCQVHKARNITERLPKHLLAFDPFSLRQPPEQGSVETTMGAVIDILRCRDLAQCCSDPSLLLHW
jgi:hypothetical protein